MSGKKITLYHYTSKEGAKSIKKSRVILQSSKFLNPQDSVFGDGVYLTAKRPEIGKFEIAGNNYGENFETEKIAVDAGKVDRVIRIKLPPHSVTKVQGIGRDVYLYHGDLHLNRKDIKWKIKKVKKVGPFISHK